MESVYPIDILPVFPNASSLRAIRFDEHTFAVLLAIAPLTIVNSTVSPIENSIALTLIIFEFSFILFPVLPH